MTPEDVNRIQHHDRRYQIKARDKRIEQLEKQLEQKSRRISDLYIGWAFAMLFLALAALIF